MAPHRALCTYDVLQEIFAHLSPNTCLTREAPHNRRALARSARACRAFQDPALDVLWEILRTLDPLFVMFSAFKVVEEAFRKFFSDERQLELGATHIMDGKVTPSEWWRRFQTYACKVREVGYDGGLSSVLAALAAYGKNQPLLPSLRRLQCKQGTVRTEAVYLISPSLRSVTIAVHRNLDDDEVIRCLIRRLTIKTPTLQVLHVLGFNSPKSLLQMVKLRNLQSLVLGNPRLDEYTEIDAPLLRAVSQLPNLTDLHLTCTCDKIGASSFNGFSKLETLYIVSKMATATRIIKAIPSPRLSTLSFCDGTPFDLNLEDLAEFMKAICATYGTSLRSIEVGCPLSCSRDIPEDHPSLDLFHPLLSMHGIEQVYIDFRFHKLSMSNQAVLDIASAWPKLTKFWLTHDCCTTRPSLDMVLAFVRRCPGLVELKLPAVNAAVLPQPLRPPLVSRTFRELHINSKRPSPIGDSAAVARYLFRAFPEIDTRRCKMYLKSQHMPWRDVFETIDIMRLERKMASMFA